MESGPDLAKSRQAPELDPRGAGQNSPPLWRHLAAKLQFGSNVLCTIGDPPPPLVRFPASLASGSESGFQYPYRWGIFLCSPPARTIVAEHGQLSAYWISEHLMKPLARSHFCSLTGLAASTQVLSSTRSQLLMEADISLGFLIFCFHISHQPQFWICEQAGFRLF